jgi:hypothetical protein
MSIPIMPSMTNTKSVMVNAEVEVFVNGIKRDIEPITILVDTSKEVGFLINLIMNEIDLFKRDNVFAPEDSIESVNSNFLGDPETILDLMQLDPTMPLEQIQYTLDNIETATLYVNLVRVVYKSVLGR